MQYYQTQQRTPETGGVVKAPGPLLSQPAAPTPRDFMERVVAWPVEGEPSYVNLHWAHPKYSMLGRPFQNLDEFMNLVQWGAQNAHAMRDIYFCLSTQSTTALSKNGKLKAVRNAKMALKLKAIWIDVDVKPEKGYGSKGEAFTAVSEFFRAADLPPPSALVLSGGGMHVYWISDRGLSVAEWERYAQGLRAEIARVGLKCDAGLTTDAARILRVPGTWNYKTTPPKAVTLKHLGDSYDFAGTPRLSRLASLAPAKVTAPVTASAAPLDLPADFDTGPAAAFAAAGRTDSLADGINTYDHMPLNPDEVFRKCLHFRDAAVTHGKGYPQGLWMMDVLAATFMEDGRRWAHYLSKGYANYSKDETDKMYERKLLDREEHGLGWPGCQAFENEGAKECATCPLRGKIKSPLNLAERYGTQPVGEHLIDHPEKKRRSNPVSALMALRKQGGSNEQLFRLINESYALVRYGRDILVACICGSDLYFLRHDDFHKMLGNIKIKVGDGSVEVSRAWLKWGGRRQYFGRGVVFEPGGPLDIPDDMLNLWRGFAIKGDQGDWSLMQRHLFQVICSGRSDLYNYLINWLAYAVQHLSEPIGVAVAFRGAQGAGKGIVARTLGKIFGKHFAHIANGDQLTGRFNAAVAMSCMVFLDEALWAGDKRGEGVLKALITEPRLQLEAKFRDPIMVDNRLRIIVASNEDWCVPAGIGDRRWFVLDVANTYAGTEHRDYWAALYNEVHSGGAEAMFHDLLKINLAGFDVRAVPPTAAKAEQQMQSLNGTNAWLYSVLHEGAVGSERWQRDGLVIDTQHAYDCYHNFSKQQRRYQDNKPEWSKKMRKALVLPSGSFDSGWVGEI